MRKEEAPIPSLVKPWGLHGAYVMKICKSQRGSVLLETALSCLILVVILVSCMEIFSIITNTLSVNKIVRESTRSASIASMQMARQGRPWSSITNIAENKCKEMNEKYLPGKPVFINCQTSGGGITCKATLSYRYLEFIREDGMGGKTINASATYPYKN